MHAASAFVSALLATGLGATATTAEAAMLPNPERPMSARSCDEAQARLAEAREGSPLIDAAANRSVLLAALEQVERLCGANDGAEARREIDRIRAKPASAS